MMKKIVIGMCVLAVVGMAQANLLTNGGFEADPFDAGWVNMNATEGGPLATVHDGLAAGSTQAAQINAGGNDLGQLTGLVASEWTVDFYAAIPDPAAYSGANRSFNLLLSDNNDPAGVTAFTWGVNLRVGANGDLQSYDNASGASWTNVGSGGEITYSIDGNGDGDFSDAGDTLNVQHIQIDGHNWGSVTSAYDVYVNGAAAGTGLTLFQTQIPDTALKSLYFRSGFGLVAGQTYVVDEVTVVPEPMTLGLLGLGMLTVIRKKNRA